MIKQLIKVKDRQSIPSQHGVILAGVLIMMILFVSMGTVLFDFAISHFVDARRVQIINNSLFAAEAGAEKTLLELNKDSAYAPPAGEVEFYNSSTKGRATYEITISNGSATNEKIVTSTGRIYYPANSLTATAKRKVRITVIAYQSTYSSSVATGVGALIMENSSKIANGQVRINGYIDMKNSATIGSAANPLEVWVPDYSCPLSGGATFPMLCDSSHKSISISSPARIYANVHKRNLVDSARITGTIDEVGADPVSMPDDNRATVKNGITSTGTTMTAAAASCQNSETRSWTNVHITGGDVTIKNSCKVTVGGNVWIDGSLTLENNGELIVDSSLTSAPTILVDGSLGAKFKNQSKLRANSSNVAFVVIAFWCGSGCSPDSTPTGNQLFNSKDTVTIDVNNGAGAAASVLYSRWGRATLSNSSAVGALVGQSIHLKNDASVTFGIALGGGGADVFNVKHYQEIYD